MPNTYSLLGIRCRLLLGLWPLPYNHIPCGDPFFGGYWRSACTLPCCVVPIKDETDSEWDPDATDVETDVDTDK